MIVSRNGVAGWTPRGPGDNAISAIVGSDPARPGRWEDRTFMGRLRAYADAVAVGAQTQRDEPRLLLTPDALPGPGREIIADWRVARGHRRFPLQVVYSASGDLDLTARLFATPPHEACVVTTEPGARRLRAAGSDARGVTLIAAGEDTLTRDGLVAAHERLFADHGVHTLLCEGGMRVLQSLRAAGVLAD